MAVCIVGMHRSGTSFVARLMQHGGLYLGESEDLLPPGPDNPDGYFEHRRFYGLNERLLRRFGGDWDLPPHLPAGWADDPGLASMRREARLLASEFQPYEPWGWKDPRTSLTLPFWQMVVPGLKVVVCIRNPLEVALSLARRNLVSYELGLHLWKTYTEQILETVGGHQYLVVHYEACLARPSAELERLADFAGVVLSDQARGDATTIASARMRHSSFTLQHLVDSRVPACIVTMYRRLCDEAGWEVAGVPPAPEHETQAQDALADSGERQPSRVSMDGAEDSMTIDADRSLRRSVVELELLRRDIAEIQESDAHHKAVAEHLQADLRERDRDVAVRERQLLEAQSEIEKRDARISELQTQDEERLTWITQIRQDLQQRESQLVQVQAEHAEWREWIDRLQGELAERNEWIAQLRTEVEQRDARHLALQGEHDEWREWIAQLRATVEERDAQLVALQGEHEEWRGWIAQLQSQIEERDARSLEVQTEHEEWRAWIGQLQADIERRDQLIALLRQEMSRRDELLAALRTGGKLVGARRTEDRVERGS